MFYKVNAYYDDACRGLASNIITEDSAIAEEFIWEVLCEGNVAVCENCETGEKRTYTYDAVLADSDCPEIVLP